MESSITWEHPPLIKIYEALGAIADGRVEVFGNTAKVYSSSRNKYYNVSYDPKTNAIMANDNGSYWKGYLGYPSIAFLLVRGVLSYNAEIANLMKGIQWKDLNQEYKNDFEAVLTYIQSSLSDEDKKILDDYTIDISIKITGLNLCLFGKKTIPPEGY